MDKANERNVSLDLLRIIAIICVIFIHISGKILVKYPDISNDDLLVAFIYNSASRIAVPIFIMLSGLLLLHKQETIGVFLKKRFFSIVPVFLLWNGIYSLYIHLQDNSEDWLYIFLKGFREPIFYHLWYIYVLLGLYLVTPFLREVFNKIDGKYIRYFLIICFGSIFLNTLIHNFFGFKLAIHTYTGIELAYYIFGGYLLFIASKYRNSFVNFVVFLSSSLVMIFVNYNKTLELKTVYRFFNGYNNIFNFMQSVFFILFILNMNVVLDKLHKFIKIFIKVIASSTLNVYLSHAIVLEIVLEIYPDILKRADYVSAIPMLAMLIYAISLVISICLDYFINIFKKV